MLSGASTLYELFVDDLLEEDENQAYEYKQAEAPVNIPKGIYLQPRNYNIITHEIMLHKSCVPELRFSPPRSSSSLPEPYDPPRSKRRRGV